MGWSEQVFFVKVASAFSWAQVLVLPAVTVKQVQPSQASVASLRANKKVIGVAQGIDINVNLR